MFTELSLNLTEPFIHSFTQRPECVEGFTERTVSLKEFTECIHSISFHRTQNTAELLKTAREEVLLLRKGTKSPRSAPAGSPDAHGKCSCMPCWWAAQPPILATY